MIDTDVWRAAREMIELYNLDAGSKTAPRTE